jgi:hypothetical protein
VTLPIINLTSSALSRLEFLYLPLALNSYHYLIPTRSERERYTAYYPSYASGF